MSNNGNHKNMPPEMTAEYEQAIIAPHSREAEEALLGSILINPQWFYEVAAFLKPSDFFILRNAWVWEAMERLEKRKELIDILTIVEELRTQGRLDDIGGNAYIVFLASNIGTSNNAVEYGQLVYRAAIRRKLLEAAGEIAKLARAEDLDIDAIIDKSNQIIINASERRTTNVRTLGSALESLIAKHTDIADGTREPDVVKTATPLDRTLAGGGLRPGGWVITADTSGGKSELTRNILENMALQKHHIHFASLEMNEEDVLTNALSRFSGIPSDYLDAKGKPTDEKLRDKYDAAMVKYYEMEPYIHFDDTETVTVFQVMTAIRRSHREFGIKAAFVDYLELIEPSSTDGKGEEADYLAIGNMFRQLRTLGRELGIPIVIPVQQNRSGQEGKKGIARSYDIVKHCDGLIYIKNADDQADNDGDEVLKLVRIDKQRRGKKGKHELTFDFARHAVSDPDDALPAVVDLEEYMR